MTKDEIVGCHHQLDGHEFVKAPGIGDGQGSLACCNPQDHKELDMTKKQQQQENQHRKETKNSDTEGADFNTIGGQYDKCVVVRSKSDIVQAVT